jgi:thioesterase domain-containing protein
MTKYYYADVMPDGSVRACFAYEAPEVGPPTEGPPDPQFEAQIEGALTSLDAPIDWAGPTPTSVLYMVDGTLTWVETAALADVAARAQVSIDALGDAARESVIINPTKSIEYQRAEAQARPYAAAGYPDPVPSCVASWARAKRWVNAGVPWTGKRAADDIIATADLWNGALDGIRDLRLDAKQHIEAIEADPLGTVDQVMAVQTQFEADLKRLMQGLIND